jgi:hypothetical protein
VNAAFKSLQGCLMDTNPDVAMETLGCIEVIAGAPADLVAPHVQKLSLQIAGLLSNGRVSLAPSQHALVCQW